MQYRDEIDGLRAIAITAVILFHAGSGLFSGGYVGVDIFFVISGYLITKIVADELKEGRFTFAAFYARRARRILPALFFMMLIVSVFCFIVLLPPDLYKYGKILVFTTVFGANFRLSAERGYFDDETRENPLLHMWSLSVEEQFYLVWPVLLLLIVRTGRGTRLAVPVLFAASLAISIAFVHWMPRSAFYHLPSRGWELLTGAALALGLVPRLSSQRLAQAVSWAGLAMMALSIFAFSRGTPFPGLAALLPTLGCAFVIHAATSHRTAASRFLSLKPVVFMGKISYSLYLWHWPLIALPSYLLMRELEGPEAAMSVALAIALAAFSWRFVEQPFRRPGLRRAPAVSFAFLNGRAFAALGVAALLVALGSYVQESGGAGWRLPPQALVVAAQKRSFQLEKFCDSYKKSKTDLYECSWGKGDNGRIPVVLWGDSHADHYLPAIVKVFSSGKFYLTPGCPPVTLPDRSPDFAQSMRNCTGNNFEVMKAILAERPAIVVLAGLWGRATSTAKDTGELAAFMKDMTAKLSGEGSKVLILGQAPAHDGSAMRCEGLRLYLGLRHEACGRIERAVVDKVNEPARIALTPAESANVRFYSPADVFCDRSWCYASKAGQWLYADGHHLNAEGGALTSETIRSAVSSLNADIRSAQALPAERQPPMNN